MVFNENTLYAFANRKKYIWKYEKENNRLFNRLCMSDYFR